MRMFIEFKVEQNEVESQVPLRFWMIGDTIVPLVHINLLEPEIYFF